MLSTSVNQPQPVRNKELYHYILLPTKTYISTAPPAYDCCQDNIKIRQLPAVNVNSGDK